MPARRVPFALLAVLGGFLSRVKVTYFINEDGDFPIESMDREPPANSHQISRPESREVARALAETEEQDRAIAFVKLQRRAGVLSSIGLGAGDDFARDGSAQSDFIHGLTCFSSTNPASQRRHLVAHLDFAFLD